MAAASCLTLKSMGRLEYAKITADFFCLDRDRPLILGLALTDICNLSCIHCRVGNVYRRHMTWDEVDKVLRDQHGSGARFLYLEGGEPLLWQDGQRRLPEVIRLAREIGYLKVHLYTNGTMPLDSSPDFTWVSVDGLPENYAAIRGSPFDRVWTNIRSGPRPLAIIFTINTLNWRDIPGILEMARDELPGVRVNFYFHTPYYGLDFLLPSPRLKGEIAETLISLKRSGLPVMNTACGLRALAAVAFRRPLGFTRVVDQTGEYRCCRAVGNPEVCRFCGYSTCAELALLQDFHPGVVRETLRLF